MILTGKAKEDFIDYLWQSKFNKHDYKEYEDYIDNQKESHTYADIIEWFDSITKPEKNFYFQEIYLECFRNGYLYTSIKEIQQQAILKANQIYNDR